MTGDSNNVPSLCYWYGQVVNFGDPCFSIGVILVNTLHALGRVNIR
jgi:hypothetical protein